MSFLSDLVLSTIFILFPLSIFLIFVAYKNNIREKEQQIIFSFCLITSLYLMLRFCEGACIHYFLLVNIPLLISFVKTRKLLSFVLIIGIATYYCLTFNINIFLVIGEYLIYYILFFLILKKKITTERVINYFVFIKGVILSFEVYYIMDIPISEPYMFLKLFLMLCIFYGLSMLIICLLEKGENIINLNNSLKELEKEKTLRSSLFKITHEIKNPISVCKGYLDMMDYSDMKKVQKYNLIIQEEINRTLTIMDDFLEYTKIKVNLDVIDIYMLLNDVVDSMVSLFTYNNINIICEEFDDELFIMGDYNKLKQAMINIIKNSVEAIKNGGNIKITTCIKKNRIIIEVKDDGTGMDEETLSKMYDMFYTTKDKGTGLGVSLSNEIIKLHKGSLNYESEVGKGTTTIIKLPIKKLSKS
ncbi:MAG TPA: HAMP domain-containing sensor histidine kinase [Bacilli bacterium]|nr:HAMP domain-containing sensor histidine kinase [Bacilli bacterium]